MAEITGVKAIAATITAHGVEYFFHASDDMIPLFIEIEDSAIELVMTRSEKAAVYMAHVSYKPGACYGQRRARMLYSTLLKGRRF